MFLKQTEMHIIPVRISHLFSFSLIESSSHQVLVLVLVHSFMISVLTAFRRPKAILHTRFLAVKEKHCWRDAVSASCESSWCSDKTASCWNLQCVSDIQECHQITDCMKWDRSAIPLYGGAEEVQERELVKCSGSEIIVQLRSSVVSQTISRYYFKLDEIRYVVYKAHGMCGY